MNRLVYGYFPAKKNHSRLLVYGLLTLHVVGLVEIRNIVFAPHAPDAEYQYVETLSERNQVQSPSKNESGKNLNGTTSKQQLDESPRVDFIATRDLELPVDAFAATWWQSRERFLELNPFGLRGPEDATIKAILDRKQDVTMTVDWLQFSVEHLSKWWKTTDYDRNYRKGGEDPVAYTRIVTNLLAYIQGLNLYTAEQQQQPRPNAMPDTIAVIAFMPYRSPRKPVWGKQLTVISLAATLASLVRVQCGRIVVVCGKGEEEESRPTVRAAIRLLSRQSKTSDSGFLASNETGILHKVIESTNKEAMMINEEGFAQPFVESIWSTEIGYVNTNVTFPSFLKDGKAFKNVPKAALIGLKEALSGESSLVHQERWLGTSHHGQNAWKYVYLTEPDSLLQTRASVFSSLQAAMDQGKILMPHRLQPIPHESDLQGYKDSTYYLPALSPFQNVTSIHTPAMPASAHSTSTGTRQHGACCDGGIRRPWQQYQKCSTFWYLCGFQRELYGGHIQISAPRSYSKEEILNNHFLLWGYPLMRLTSGSNLVSLAGTEHGRRCYPQENGECPMHDVELHALPAVEKSTLAWNESRLLFSVHVHENSSSSTIVGKGPTAESP